MPRLALLVSGGTGVVLAAALRLVGDQGASPAVPLHPPVDEEAVLARFLARPDEPHRRLRGLRHLRAEGLGKQAFMDVRVALDAEGLRFQVEAEGGSGLLRDYVFRGMLQQEQEAYASQHRRAHRVHRGQLRGFRRRVRARRPGAPARACPGAARRRSSTGASS